MSASLHQPVSAAVSTLILLILLVLNILTIANRGCCLVPVGQCLDSLNQEHMNKTGHGCRSCWVQQQTQVLRQTGLKTGSSSKSKQTNPEFKHQAGSQQGSKHVKQIYTEHILMVSLWFLYTLTKQQKAVPPLHELLPVFHGDSRCHWQRLLPLKER